MADQKEVLVLTGACGVGKSTIAKAWAKSKAGVCIESDYLLSGFMIITLLAQTISIVLNP